MMALVAGVISDSSKRVLMLNVVGSMSTNTGLAPSRQAALAVAKNV